MPLLRHALFYAARRLASDARLRRRAADVLENEVKPRARAVLREVEPKVRAVREDLKDAARTVDVRKDPVGFANEAANRLRRRRRKD